MRVVELFGFERAQGFDLHAHVNGHRCSQFSSVGTRAQIVDAVSAAYDDVNGILASWKGSEDDYERLEQAQRGWGARLGNLMLDERGQRFLHNVLSAGCILTVLGAIEMWPWEMVFVGGAGSGGFFGDKCIVVRIGYGEGGLEPGNINLENRMRGATSKYVGALSTLGFVAIDRAHDLHHAALDKESVTVCAKAAEDGAALRLSESGKFDYNLLAAEGYKFRARGIVVLLSCGAARPSDPLDRLRIGTAIARASNCTVAGFAGLIPDAEVKGIAKALVEASDGGRSGESLGETLLRWKNSLGPFGRLLRVFGAWGPKVATQQRE